MPRPSATRLPNSGIVPFQGRITAPLGIHRRLASGVGELQPDHRTLRVHEVGDATPGGDLLVVPDAGVVRRDAAIGSHAGRLGDDQACAAARERSEVHEVPVGRDAVALDDRVLAQRRHPDAIAHAHPAQVERVEERGHAGEPSDRGCLSQASQEGAQFTHPGEDVARDADRLGAVDVDLLVVDEHHVGRFDSQFAGDVPVDLGVGLDHAQFGADEHLLEVPRERCSAERVAEVEAGVREQRDPGAAGVQLGEDVDRPRLDADPAAKVGRPEPLHLRRTELETQFGANARPVVGNVHACRGRGRRGASSTPSRTVRPRPPRFRAARVCRARSATSRAPRRSRRPPRGRGSSARGCSRRDRQTHRANLS